jgi:hypothetical protein
MSQGANLAEAQALEAFLARLLVEPDLRVRFLAAPAEEAARAGLDPEACASLCALDPAGLELAAASFDHKRAQASRRSPRSRLARWRRLVLLGQRWVTSLRT